jgi:flagellar FliL protein
MEIMANATTEPTDANNEEAAPRKSRKPMLIGLVLFIFLGGAGFYATFFGMMSVSAMMGGSGGGDDGYATEEHMDVPAFAFASIGEMVIPLGPKANSDFLLLEVEIEVSPGEKEGIEAQMPRIWDMFNTYLRAVEARDLEAQDATLRLRAHLLRRVGVLIAPLEPRDLLFTTFILK